jgi:hypothetical protein
MSIGTRVPLVVLCVLTAALAVSSAPVRLTASERTTPAAPALEISPAALAQIDALIAEKATRTGLQRKLDSQIVYELKMEQGESIARGVDELATDLPYTPDYQLEINANAGVTDTLLSQLRAMGVAVVDANPAAGTIRLLAWITEIAVR